MKIRTEKAGDFCDVFQLNYLAFNHREDEARLIERIRLSEQFIPELSLVAAEDEHILGHALFSRAAVADQGGSYDVIVLAPIAVMPNRQKQGIGGKLIREGLKRCAELGFQLVFLIGDPAYYPKFGFKSAGKYGFELQQFKVPDDVFMVIELTEGVAQKIKGELKYPPSFFI